VAVSVPAAISSPVNTTPPVISGTPVPGSTLTCSTGTWSNGPTGYSYEWNRDGTAITGAASQTYIVGAGDQGHSLTCTVTAANAAGSGQPATSTPVSVPAPAPPKGTPATTAAPVITGPARAGKTLSCSTGAWTNHPTTFAYQWSRDTTPIHGATGASYTIQKSDEQLTLTCTVTASNPTGTGLPSTSKGVQIPVARMPGCPAASGRLAGSTLGLVRLGMTRKQARDAYTHSTDRGRKYEDFFCLTPIGVRVGYPSITLLKSIAANTRNQLKNRVIWASTSSGYYTLAGIRPGASISAAATALKLTRPFQIGRNTWYLASNGSSTAVLKTRQGIVQEIGIASKQLAHGRKAQRTFLKSFS
jgi:hypothetical protein